MDWMIAYLVVAAAVLVWCWGFDRRMAWGQLVIAGLWGVGVLLMAVALGWALIDAAVYGGRRRKKRT